MKIDDDLLPDERAMLEGKTTTTPMAEAPQEAQPAAAAAAEAGEGGETIHAAAEGAPAGDAALDADALAAVAEDDEAGKSEKPTTYELPEVDFKAARAKLTEQVSDVDKRWSDGNLTDEERAAELAKLQDARDDLVAQETEARTIANINRQNLIRSQTQTLAALMDSSKKANEIDYSDAKNQASFDSMLRAVHADPSNEGKSYPELTQMAHDALCAIRGVKRAAPAMTPAPAPSGAPAPAADAPAAKPAPARPTVPPTLASMPVASTPPVGNDFLSTLNSMDDPDAAEAALAALPKSQREAQLRATIPAATRR